MSTTGTKLINMSEKDFLDGIDYKFPYTDLSRAKEVINDAIDISDNSVFGVIEEIVRPPKSWRGRVNKNDLMELLDYVDGKFQHPFKNDLFDISRKIISNKEILTYQTLNAMDRLKAYKGLYAALNILYFSGEDSEKIEDKYNEIIAYWENRSGKLSD